MSCFILGGLWCIRHMHGWYTFLVHIVTSAKRLQLVSRKRWIGDYCHAVFHAMVECSDWQIQIIFFQGRTTGRSFAGLSWVERNRPQTSKNVSPSAIRFDKNYLHWLQVQHLRNRHWSYPGAVEKEYTVFPVAETAGIKFPNFPGLSDCLFTATALINSNRCPHGCYTFSSMLNMSPGPTRRRLSTFSIYEKRKD